MPPSGHSRILTWASLPLRSSHSTEARLIQAAASFASRGYPSHHLPGNSTVGVALVLQDRRNHARYCQLLISPFRLGISVRQKITQMKGHFLAGCQRWCVATVLAVGLGNLCFAASEKSPARPQPRAGLKPFEYTDAPGALPNYVPGAKWGTQAEPIRTMQKPLSPEESMKHLVTLPGFKVSLFAAEPEIAKPIWMAWDARGRLWIAETVDYPNDMQPAGQGHDRRTNSLCLPTS